MSRTVILQATSHAALPARAMLVCCTLLLSGAAARVQAQSTELARVDSLIAATRLTEARTTLDRWQQSHGRNASGTDAAYALLLRGRLATRADSALTAYLEVALGYPSSPAAPEALLRLGQAAVAQGELDRGAGYLQRLTRDYPGAAQQSAAQAWLARAVATPSRPSPARAAATRSTPPPMRAAASLAVQVGAFRDQGAARALVRRLTERGFDARVVYIGRGTLALVRVGRFRTGDDAAATLRRIRALHRDAVIVEDVARERSSP